VGGGGSLLFKGYWNWLLNLGGHMMMTFPIYSSYLRSGMVVVNYYPDVG